MHTRTQVHLQRLCNTTGTIQDFARPSNRQLRPTRRAREANAIQSLRRTNFAPRYVSRNAWETIGQWD